MATVTQPLPIGAAQLFASAGVGVPEFVSVQTTPATPTPGYSAYAFDQTVVESLYYEFVVRNYGSGNLTLNIQWSTTPTSNAAVFAAQIGCITGGTDTGNVTAKTYATATTVTATARANAGALNTSSITISNLDSIASGDLVFLRFYRDAAAGGDTLTADALVYHLDLTYSDV